MKPVITARDRKLARNASLKIQNMKNKTPIIRASARAYCKRIGSPGDGEGHQGGADQSGHGGVGTGYQVA